MSFILAIDTANEYLALALSNGNHCLSSLTKVGNTQSQQILKGIDHLLQQFAITPTDLTEIIYNQGPGSFTGLRIGLSVGLGLAYSASCRLIPIPAFYSYVQRDVTCAEYQVVVLDARLNQVYAAAYKTADLSEVMAPGVLTATELAALLHTHPVLRSTNTQLIGPGLNAYASIFTEQLTGWELNSNTPYPDPSCWLELKQTGLFPAVDAFNAELLYIRNKVALNLAEQKLLKSHAN
jgi:tRNA threonylcarbamoyladenosine biosynthesis protein TsaB